MKKIKKENAFIVLGIVAIAIVLITIGIKDYEFNMAEKSTIVFPPVVSSSSTSDSSNTYSSINNDNTQVTDNTSQGANTNSYS